jgi:hypothetical protein
MANFNVTLIKPDGYLHSLALAEAAEYLYWSIAAAGHRPALTTNRLFNDAHNVVVCGHMLPDEALAALPADTIVFNSEQLFHREGWYLKPAYSAALARCHVWDYSLRNLPAVGHDRKAFIPFLFCPELVRKAPRQPGQALYFYGVMPERRRRLVAGLEAAGVPVEIIAGKYTGERDAEIFKAWAILNMRQYDVVTTFEAVRCSYALNNGLAVISETAGNDPTFALYADWIFSFDTDALVEGAARLHREPEAFARAAAEKLDAFRATSSKETMAEAIDAYLTAPG